MERVNKATAIRRNFNYHPENLKKIVIIGSASSLVYLLLIPVTLLPFFLALNIVALLTSILYTVVNTRDLNNIIREVRRHRQLESFLSHWRKLYSKVRYTYVISRILYIITFLILGFSFIPVLMTMFYYILPFLILTTSFTLFYISRKILERSYSFNEYAEFLFEIENLPSYYQARMNKEASKLILSGYGKICRTKNMMISNKAEAKAIIFKNILKRPRNREQDLFAKLEEFEVQVARHLIAREADQDLIYPIRNLMVKYLGYNIEIQPSLSFSERVKKNKMWIEITLSIVIPIIAGIISSFFIVLLQTWVVLLFG